MTQPKRRLSGAALQNHLKKEFKTLEDFHSETLRLEEEIRQTKLERNPLYRSSRCFGWGIFMGSLVGIAALFFQPNQINVGLVLGFAMGTAGSALERRE